MCRGDLMDFEFRRQLIDVFINSVYLFDDRVVIVYNIKNGKQVSAIDVLNAVEELDGVELFPDSAEDSSAGGNGSFLVADAPPKQLKYEPQVFFIKETFGLVFGR